MTYLILIERGYEVGELYQKDEEKIKEQKWIEYKLIVSEKRKLLYASMKIKNDM